MEREYFNDLKIPFLTQKNNSNPEKVKELISLIMQNIIDKESQIKIKNKKIDKLIENELTENQKAEKFEYQLPMKSGSTPKERIFSIDWVNIYYKS